MKKNKWIKKGQHHGKGVKWEHSNKGATERQKQKWKTAKRHTSSHKLPGKLKIKQYNPNQKCGMIAGATEGCADLPQLVALSCIYKE